MAKPAYASAAHGHRSVLAAACCLLAAVLLLLPACGDEPRPTAAKRHHPVILIGVDGLEWTVALPLLRQGKLPHMAQLMRTGVYGELGSSKPTSSPIIWTSIATGHGRERHGILGFVDKRSSLGNDPRLFNNRDRRTKAIWNILSEHQMKVSVIGWWMTYPVEAINGVMVAQTNTTPQSRKEHRSQAWKGALYTGVEGQVHPPERQEEILAHVPEVDARLPALVAEIFGPLPSPASAIPGVLWQESLWSIRADEIYRRVGLDLLKSGDDFDLFAIYFGAADVLGHRYWQYLEPEAYDHPPRRRTSGRTVRSFPATTLTSTG